MTMATSISPKDIVSANRLELLQIADAVASEKRVDRATVFAAVEKTVAKAMATRYGAQQDIRATINPDSGEIRVFRHREIVEEVEDPHIQIHIDLARVQDPDAELGGSYIEELPMAELERTGSQAGKQVMHQKVREAERMSQYEEFKDRLGDIITGVVKLAERGNVTVDTQRGEAIMRRDQSIPRENFRIGDRVRALIVEVQNETPGPQVLLSRSSPEFMLKLFAQEVPEVYEGIIEIRAVARDPGSRAKIAVISNNSSIDPVGACVGMRGSRVQTIVNELHGERIDVIPWSANPELFITASPAAGAGDRGDPSRGGKPCGSDCPGRRRQPEQGDRKARTECAPRLQTHRLANLHPDRGSIFRTRGARARRADCHLQSQTRSR